MVCSPLAPNTHMKSGSVLDFEVGKNAALVLKNFLDLGAIVMLRPQWEPKSKTQRFLGPSCKKHLTADSSNPPASTSESAGITEVYWYYTHILLPLATSFQEQVKQPLGLPFSSSSKAKRYKRYYPVIDNLTLIPLPSSKGVFSRKQVSSSGKALFENT